jgi:putative molybdopterin biosynthesis protein
VVIPAQTERLAAGTPVQVHLIADRLEPADLVTIGSHCVGLDYLLGRLQAEGYSTKSLHVGSQGGLAAARRGECDLGGIHLMHPDTGIYNQDYLTDELQLVTGYRRMQGVVFRPDDPRFSDRETARDAVAAALADPDCVMVNRNAGSGTRILIDGLLGEARPTGYAVQTKSHNAVASAVVQGRADWGIAIDTVAHLYGLGFLPLQEEHYDFVVPRSRLHRPALRRLLEMLAGDETRAGLRELGFGLDT